MRECVNKFDSIYLFTFVNIRNNTLKEVRKLWHPSRIIIGKNKVISVAFGKSKEDEVEKGLHKVSCFICIVVIYTN